MFGLFAPRQPQVSTREVAERLKAGSAPFILDVREPAEYAGGHIPGSKLVSLGTLGSRLQDLPRDREIVVVCRSGARSASATQLLIQNGFHAINMAGGMMAWQGPVER